MNVKDIISTMKTLGIGEVHSDDDILLRYLNLAHDELYRETAIFNQDIFFNEPPLQNQPNENFVTLTKNPFSVINVYITQPKIKLYTISLIKFTEYKFESQNVGNPVVCCNVGTKLMFFPFKQNIVYNFDIWQIPERSAFDINTPEYLIPYPLSYQSILVEGGLYYLFNDEGGFRDSIKAETAKMNWVKGKKDLLSYFYSSNKEEIYTFRNV